MVFRAAEKRRFEKEEEIADAAATGLLQLCDYFFFSKQRTNHHHPIEDNPSTPTTTNNKKSNLRTLSEIMSMSSVEEDHRMGKAEPSMRDMHGLSKRKKKSMKPEISAAKHLLQLCVENSFSKDLAVTPKFKEDYLKSHHMDFIDKLKVEDEHTDHDDDEESKSDVSYITDDCSDMETTLAEITAAQQIMQLSNSHQQQATTLAEQEDEKESTAGYNKIDMSAASSTAVVPKRKDFEEEEENNSFLPRRKRKFRSLADLYEITQPLEDDPCFD